MAFSMRSQAIIAVACALSGGAGPCAAQVITTYGYDAQGQVISVNRPASTITYGYDAAGNRVALGASAPPAGAIVQTGASESSASKAAQVDSQPLAQADGGDFGLDDVIAATAYAWASAPGTGASNTSPTAAGQVSPAAAPPSSR